MSADALNWAGTELAAARYQVVSVLGEGGMGHVYRARDRNLDCDVVIKVPRRIMMEDPAFADRFQHEVRSLVKLKPWRQHRFSLGEDSVALCRVTLLPFAV